MYIELSYHIEYNYCIIFSLFFSIIIQVARKTTQPKSNKYNYNMMKYKKYTFFIF